MDFNSSIPSSAKGVMLWADYEEQRKQNEKVYRHQLEDGAKASIRQNQLLQAELNTLRAQTKFLADSNEALQKMYDSQVQAERKAKRNFWISLTFNIIMAALAVLPLLPL